MQTNDLSPFEQVPPYLVVRPAKVHDQMSSHCGWPDRCCQNMKCGGFDATQGTSADD